jgi:hypothetical protein
MQRIDKIAASTLRSLVTRVNEIYTALFSNYTTTSLTAADYFLIEKGGLTDDFKKIAANDVSDYISTGGTTDNSLTEWAQGKDYEPLIITRDSEGRVTTMTVKWPDESDGVYTATSYNVTHEVYDGYNITHTDSSKIITQTAVTRNSEGAITNKPALTII